MMPESLPKEGNYGYNKDGDVGYGYSPHFKLFTAFVTKVTSVSNESPGKALEGLKEMLLGLDLRALELKVVEIDEVNQAE